MRVYVWIRQLTNKCHSFFILLGKNNTNVNLILNLKERRHSQNKKHKLKEEGTCQFQATLAIGGSSL